MQFNPWDVWWADVAFEDSIEVKRRPVLVLSHGDIFVLCLKMTSQPPRAGEYSLKYWQMAGLKKSTTVRTSKKLRLVKSAMVSKIGSLSTIDRIEINKLL